MKESSEKATEVDNELRLNVDEQPDDKTFKVARNPRKKNKPVCVTCNQKKLLKNG